MASIEMHSAAAAAAKHVLVISDDEEDTPVREEHHSKRSRDAFVAKSPRSSDASVARLMKELVRSEERFAGMEDFLAGARQPLEVDFVAEIVGQLAIAVPDGDDKLSELCELHDLLETKNNIGNHFNMKGQPMPNGNAKYHAAMRARAQAFADAPTEEAFEELVAKPLEPPGPVNSCWISSEKTVKHNRVVAAGIVEDLRRRVRRSHSPLAEELFDTMISCQAFVAVVVRSAEGKVYVVPVVPLCPAFYDHDWV
jgi:hypothetical protein